MTPNNQLDVDSRFRRLVEAVKLVWASTFFREAKELPEDRAQVGRRREDGGHRPGGGRARHGERFYPNVSGVARSYNYYPTGNAQPGRTAWRASRSASARRSWTASRAGATRPPTRKAPPPYNSIGELLDATQREFWAVNMGTGPLRPGQETEHLVRCSLADAEADGTPALRRLDLRPECAADRPRHRAKRAAPRSTSRRSSSYNQLSAQRHRATAPRRVRGRGWASRWRSSSPSPSSRGRRGAVRVPAGAAAGGGSRGGRRRRRRARGTGRAGRLAARPRQRRRTTRSSTSSTSSRRRSTSAATRRDRQGARGDQRRDCCAMGDRYLLIGFGRWGTSDQWGGVPVRLGPDLRRPGHRRGLDLWAARGPLAGLALLPQPDELLGALLLARRHRRAAEVDWAWLDAPAGRRRDPVPASRAGWPRRCPSGSTAGPDGG